MIEERTINDFKEKELMLSEEDLSFILNSAIASASVKEVITPYKSFRGQIHILIYGSIGSGKSSILYTIGDNLDIIPVTSLSKAHIQGSVDGTTGDLSQPIIWEHRNSCVLIDEFHIDPKNGGARDSLNILLSVMENAKYKKKVGYRCNEFHEVDKNDKSLYCKVKKNTIECKTRFVLILNTMMELKRSQLIEIKALATRCICVPFKPSHQQLKGYVRGEPMFKFNPKKLEQKSYKINKKDYDKILEFVDNYHVPSTKYMRTVNDICRLFVIHGRIIDDKFKKVMDLASNGDVVPNQ